MELRTLVSNRIFAVCFFSFPKNRFYTPSFSDPKLTFGNAAVFSCGEKHPKAIHLDHRGNISVRACARALFTQEISGEKLKKTKFPLRGAVPGLEHGLKRAWQAERVAEVLGEPPAKANRSRNMTHACFQWSKLAHANGVPQ